ncbi:Hypothetical predicted protein [Podarcis lilfordi]|uniref:Uncharacterized protein n=1 Tax=Podarcis lilfordi TaxID=74358 RepID=A0AA35P5C0_9SAUR|nr:Hypothetical predicted protein [Podarcis lilfordi]
MGASGGGGGGGRSGGWLRPPPQFAPQARPSLGGGHAAAHFLPRSFLARSRPPLSENTGKSSLLRPPLLRPVRVLRRDGRAAAALAFLLLRTLPLTSARRETAPLHQPLSQL